MPQTASSLIGGVGRDAAYVAGRVASLTATKGTPRVIRSATPDTEGA